MVLGLMYSLNIGSMRSLKNYLTQYLIVDVFEAMQSLVFSKMMTGTIQGSLRRPDDSRAGTIEESRCLSRRERNSLVVGPRRQAYWHPLVQDQQSLNKILLHGQEVIPNLVPNNQGGSAEILPVPQRTDTVFFMSSPLFSQLRVKVPSVTNRSSLKGTRELASSTDPVEITAWP